MSDYGYVHEGRVFTPNQTAGVTVEENAGRNAAIQEAELTRWATAPDHFAPAYYHFPAEDLPLFGKPRPWREHFSPCLHTYVNKSRPEDPGVDHVATVTTWLGATLGVITSARVYRHNFGGRMVAIRVKGTNGAEYYGRASWDGGDVIRLRRVAK